MPVGVGEEDDRLFGVVDDVAGEVGLIVDDQRDDVRARDVVGGDDGELVPGDARLEIDVADRCRGAPALRTVIPCSMPGSARSST